MSIQIQTGDGYTDTFLSAGAFFLEELSSVHPGIIRILGPAEAEALTIQEKKESACLLVLYQQKEYPLSALHRRLAKDNIEGILPYTCLPLPVSLPAYYTALYTLLHTTGSAKKNVSILLQEENGILRYGTKEVLLTAKEFSLFRLLYENRGQIVPQDVILTQIWPEGAAGNVCQVYITYLRKKLEPLFGISALTSVRGKGYLLRIPEEETPSVP